MLALPKTVLRSAWESSIRLGFRAGRLRMLFIVGHMRSGSSLLLHLLASHPEVAGLGELHLDYRGAGDFPRAAWQIHRELRDMWPGERWVLDKVLHDYFAHPAVPARAGARAVFLLRDPEQAVPSIVDLGLKPYPDAAAAVEYYERRLAAIERVHDALPEADRLVLTYRELTTRSSEALERLTAFLELRTPLRPTYDLLPSTGRSGLGDPSETIHAGRILSRTGSGYATSLEPEVLERVRGTYARTLRRLGVAR